MMGSVAKKLRLLVAVLTFVVSGSHAGDYDICLTSDITTGGPGDSGTIFVESDLLLTGTSPSCVVTVTTCPECRLRLEILEMNVSFCAYPVRQNGCNGGCSFLHALEPDYTNLNNRYLQKGSVGDSYVSLSRQVQLMLCYMRKWSSFKLQYTVETKLSQFSNVDAKVESGDVFSPNFPNSYARNGDVFQYHIHNQDPSGFVRLWFDDWELSNNSKIEIIYSEDRGPSGILTRYGFGARPYVVSTGPDFWVKFHTGEDSRPYKYMGFRMRYQFVPAKVWPNKPTFTDCGHYLIMLWGGHLTFDRTVCQSNLIADCIWVVKKISFPTDRLSLHVTESSFLPGDLVEIRSGLNSQGPLVATTANSSAGFLQDKEWVDSQGFHVHIRAHCTTSRKFTAVFTSFMEATRVFGLGYSYTCSNLANLLVCPKKHRCINKSLRCDGYDHCGDGADETNCHIPVNTDKTPAACNTYMPCQNANKWYCGHQKCNGVLDCEDGSDESHCWDYSLTTHPIMREPSPYTHDTYYWGIITPVVLIIIILIIIVCIIISYYTRKKRLRQRHLAFGRDLRSAVTTVNGSMQRPADAPPSYEEAVRVNYTPGQGAINMGYNNDALDFLVEPPAYSSKYDSRLPIRYIPITTPQQQAGPSSSGATEGSTGPPPPPPPPPRGDGHVDAHVVCATLGGAGPPGGSRGSTVQGAGLAEGTASTSHAIAQSSRPTDVESVSAGTDTDTGTSASVHSSFHGSSVKLDADDGTLPVTGAFNTLRDHEVRTDGNRDSATSFADRTADDKHHGIDEDGQSQNSDKVDSAANVTVLPVSSSAESKSSGSPAEHVRDAEIGEQKSRIPLQSTDGTVNSAFVSDDEPSDSPSGKVTDVEERLAATDDVKPDDVSIQKGKGQQQMPVLDAETSETTKDCQLSLDNDEDTNTSLGKSTASFV